MATAKERQSNFLGGEFSPGLWPRTELEWYATGARTLLNMIPLPLGGATNRPGTLYIAPTAAHGAARLVPFNFSDEDALILVFTENLITPYRGPVAAGAPIVTTYTAAQLRKLRTAQVGDVITITCAGHPVRELARLTATPTWSLEPVDFEPPEPYFGDGTPRVLYSSILAADTTHPAKEWEWRLTTILRDRKTGRTWETTPFKVTYSVEYGTGSTPPPETVRALPAKIVCYGDKPITLDWMQHGGLLLDQGWDWLATRVYRGRGTLFGLVGETTGYEFTDDGDLPNYKEQPPLGRNPFYFPSPEHTEHPGVVAFHEQRRMLARTAERPGWIFASRVANYASHDTYIPSKAEDAFEFEVAASRLEEIRAIVPAEDLIVLTSCAEWVVGGSGQDAAMGPSSIRARQVTQHGSSWVAPLKIGSSVLFVQAKGSVVRDLSYNADAGGLDSVDLALRAKHLFTKRTVVDLAYAEDPWGIVWAVLDDGTLLSLTYDRAGKRWGWARHATAGGAVESICTIPEGDEDVLYLVVRRTVCGATKRYIERMATRVVTDAAEGLFLDCAATTRGAGLTEATGLGHLEGRTVSALADGFPVHDLVVAGGKVALPEGFGTASVIHVGLQRDSDFQSLDSPNDRTRQKTVAKVWVEYEGSRGGWAGTDLSDPKTLEEFRQRTVEEAEAPPLETGMVPVLMRGRWEKGGAVGVRQRDPLPLTIVAITREVVYGG